MAPTSDELIGHRARINRALEALHLGPSRIQSVHIEHGLVTVVEIIEPTIDKQNMVGHAGRPRTITYTIDGTRTTRIDPATPEPDPTPEPERAHWGGNDLVQP